MRPLVYVLEEQIAEIYRSASAAGQITDGAGFEWRDENVYHAFSRYPRVAPAGKPCLARFVFTSTVPRPTDYEHYQSGLPSTPERFLIICFWVENSVLAKRAFVYNRGEMVEAELRYVPQRSDLYSRSKGLLEVDILEKKRVIIAGLGSFGSTIAVELAKAGVGAFALYDFDRIELANISRHVAGVSDLGRYKTHAVRDAILNKNPFAKVDTAQVDINEHVTELKKTWRDCDLIVCATDENRSRSNVNSLAVNMGKVAIFGRAITRAAGGDVFRLRPGRGPCLACIQGAGLYRALEEVSNKRQALRDAAAYTTSAQIDAAIQVGLASDIAPITNMVVKLALVELCRGTESGISSLEEDLTADFYIWANRRDMIYSEWPKMEQFFNRHSILRWYGARAPRSDDCIVCNPELVATNGGEISL